MEATRTVATERIRGPNLAVLIKYLSRVPFEEGLRKANEGNHVIASNTRLSKALVGSDEWRKIKDAFACWSGTMTAYVEPNAKLPAQIEYTDPDTGHRWVFSVLEQYIGKTNAILVAEHPDYTLEIDGNNRVVHATSIDLVEQFPEKDGWYKGDPKHDIPVVSPDGSDRYLWRTRKRVGPAARGYDNFLYVYYNRHYVGLGDRPSDRFGMVVEAPLGGAPREMTAPMQLKLTRQGDGELIVKGTPAQIEAAIKLLQSLGY